MLGDEWVVSSEVHEQLEKFTCLMYGEARETAVDTVRAKMIKKMVGDDLTPSCRSKVDLAKLPPCQSSLIPHVQRVNYRVAGYKRADVSIFEKPKAYEEGCGWNKDAEGLIEPLWSVAQILPQSLVDLLSEVPTEEEEESRDLDYEDLLDYVIDDQLKTLRKLATFLEQMYFQYFWGK